MEMKEKLEIQKGEVKSNLKRLKMGRDNLLRIGVIDGSYIPKEEREEFRNMILDFLNSRIEMEEFNKNELEDSLAFYTY